MPITMEIPAIIEFLSIVWSAFILIAIKKVRKVSSTKRYLNNMKKPICTKGRLQFRTQNKIKNQRCWDIILDNKMLHHSPDGIKSYFKL